MERAIKADPLYELNSAERELIWKFRLHCTTIPEALPKLLRSVNWADLDQVGEFPGMCLTRRCVGSKFIDLCTHSRAGIRGAQTTQSVVSHHDGRGSRAARLSLRRRESQGTGGEKIIENFQQRTEEFSTSTGAGELVRLTS